MKIANNKRLLFHNLEENTTFPRIIFVRQLKVPDKNPEGLLISLLTNTNVVRIIFTFIYHTVCRLKVRLRVLKKSVKEPWLLILLLRW